jgi:hypothetical protein
MASVSASLPWNGLSVLVDFCKTSAVWDDWFRCGAPLTLKRIPDGSSSLPDSMHRGTYGSNLTRTTFFLLRVSLRKWLHLQEDLREILLGLGAVIVDHRCDSRHLP